MVVVSIRDKKFLYSGNVADMKRLVIDCLIRLLSLIFRVTGCLAEETRVLKPLTRFTRRRSWRSTENTLKSSSSSYQRKTVAAAVVVEEEEEEEEAAAGWEETWGAEVLTHREGAGLPSLRTRAGTQCPSQRIGPSTLLALARSQRYCKTFKHGSGKCTVEFSISSPEFSSRV